MDLVVHQVGQLQDVDVADRDRVVVRLAGAAVVQRGLAVGGHLHGAVDAESGLSVAEDLLDGRVAAGVVLLVPVGTVEHRGRHPHGGVGPGTGLGLGAAERGAGEIAGPLPAPAGGVAEVGLEHLAHVHPARHAERVQDDVDRGAVGQVRHVLDREDLGDDALVAVAAGQLVALGDLALLGHVDPDQLVHAGRQLVGVVAGEHPDVDDLARLAVGHLEARCRGPRGPSHRRWPAAGAPRASARSRPWG